MPSNCAIQKDIGHPIYAVYYNRIRKKICAQDERRGMFRVFREGAKRKGKRTLTTNTNYILS